MCIRVRIQPAARPPGPRDLPPRSPRVTFEWRARRADAMKAVSPNVMPKGGEPRVPGPADLAGVKSNASVFAQRHKETRPAWFEACELARRAGDDLERLADRLAGVTGTCDGRCSRRSSVANRDDARNRLVPFRDADERDWFPSPESNCCFFSDATDASPPPSSRDRRLVRDGGHTRRRAAPVQRRESLCGGGKTRRRRRDLHRGAHHPSPLIPSSDSPHYGKARTHFRDESKRRAPRSTQVPPTPPRDVTDKTRV